MGAYYGAELGNAVLRVYRAHHALPVLHVAGLKTNRHIANGVKVFGIYKGVRVGIMRTNGKIATVFPDSNQAAALKRRKK